MDNERLVFDPGNVWGSDLKTAPFFVIPSWWRRFLFRVLSARNFAVYAYVISVCDRNGIAYPSPEQIASDLDVKSRVIVNRALDDLVDLGFLLRTEERVRIRRAMKRTVFQRPAPSFTLLRLLQKGLIGGDLFPPDTSEDAHELDFSQSAVELGLKNMLERDAFNRYQSASDKKKALEEALTLDLERRRAA
jgi:hypothetical protein